MRHTVPEELDGERLDRIVAVLGDLSRSQARALVDAGSVTDESGVPLEANRRLEPGTVVVFEPPEPQPLLVAHPADFATVHADEHLFVVSKPSGLTVHPGSGTGAVTLAAGLLWEHPELEGVGAPGRWGIVHRLDKATSGLLVVARTQQSHDALSRMIRAREIVRTYQALVAGTMPIPRGTIDAPIGPDPIHPTRRSLSPLGKPAVTHYRRTAGWSTVGVSLLRVELETGRTHQIRVHLAGIGHHVLGDRVYGGRDPVRVPRLALHAAEVAFDHPITGEHLVFADPLPADLAEVVASLGEPDPS